MRVCLLWALLKIILQLARDKHRVGPIKVSRNIWTAENLMGTVTVAENCLEEIIPKAYTSKQRFFNSLII